MESEEETQLVTYWNTERSSLVQVLDEGEITPDDSASLVPIPSKTCSLSISSPGDPYQLPNMTSEDGMLFRYCKTDPRLKPCLAHDLNGGI